MKTFSRLHKLVEYKPLLHVFEKVKVVGFQVDICTSIIF